MKELDINENEFLARWLDNQLTPEEEEAFKKTDAYATYSKINEYAQHLEAPEYNKEKVFKNIQSKTTKQTKVRRLSFGWVSGIAASIVVLLGVFFLLQNNDTQYTSGYGEQLAVVLPDGSNVTLHANSTLSLNEDDWKDGKRNLNLKGDAYFKVEKGSLFAVNTAHGKVEVLGTQFNVNAHANNLEVKCYSGKVRVTDNLNERILTKGKAIRLINNTTEAWTFDTQKEAVISNQFAFNNSPLSKVFAALENQYNLSFTNKDSFGNKRFTGRFSKTSKDEALQTVLEAMNIDYTIDNNTVKLTK
ncbi:FecR family protein [Lacinutrix salivirga]